MSLEIIEPILRSMNPVKDAKTETNKVSAESVSLNILKNTNSQSKIKHMSKSYESNNTPYGKSNKDTSIVFRRQMFGYFESLYSLINQEDIKNATKSLQSFLNSFKITSNKESIEFYRLVSYVHSQLNLNSFSNNKDSLLIIIKNLSLGFKDY